jgi:DNA polymerase-4
VRGLQRRLWDELQVPASFGLAANKLVAQIASKLRKPQGFVTVAPGAEEAFLAPLSIGRLPGIGPKTEAALKERHGLVMIGDILVRSETELHAIFGDGWRDMRGRTTGRWTWSTRTRRVIRSRKRLAATSTTPRRSNAC